MPITHLSLYPRDKVLPCPFCGGTVIDLSNTHTACYTITCISCDAEITGEAVGSGTQSHRLTKAQHRRAKKSALAKWNTRAEVA